MAISRRWASTIVALMLASLAQSQAASADSASVLLLPDRTVLYGPQATQRLVVESRADGRFAGDVTEQATFATSDPKVVVVENDGVVRAVGDGSAVISAKVGNQLAIATVEVQGTGQPFAWSFRNHVLSVLTKAGCNSGACHGAAAGKNGFRLTLRGFDPQADHNVLTRQALGRRIVKTEPARSLMLLKPTTTINHAGGKRFDVGSLEYRVLAEWIAAGTPPPSEDDPHVDRLEVFPAEATLQPPASQQILVRAHFSDGHMEDVTRWAKYASTDDNTATVDDTGRITVQGHGEGVLTVWYLSKVAVARVSIPYPTPPMPSSQGGDRSTARPSPGGDRNTSPPLEGGARGGRDITRHNFIDDLVLKKLEALNLPPSPLCTDSEFIRRAYLDAAGILPSAEEVEKFLADPAPDKRRRLIDALVERPEFVDYWAYKWSDLFLVSTRRLPSGAMWSFYDWVHDAVAANKPWDRIARELIAAKGSTLANGAANYFVLHKDPADLAETTSVALLGTSIACAKCHNHPMEKWTMHDYYGMANLFARVKQKDGDAPGEVLVFLGDRENVNHPRLGRPLPPRPLDAEPMPLESAGDRRAFFADWLTAPENPLFARALVNRVWANFMGRGLVEAVDDLRATNPAMNEELFAALARDFVANGYDVKQLIRTIMGSAAYQRSSTAVAGNAEDTKFYSHYLARRLPAEVLLDCLSQVTGVPTEFSGYPKGRRALQLPDSQIGSYFLDAFGRPRRETTCECERTDDPSLAQTLHLANGPTLNDKLKAKGGTIDRMLEQNLSDEDVLRQLYLSALSRLPTDAERQQILPALATASPPSEGGARRGTPPEVDAKQPHPARRELIEDLFWATLTSKEFLFNH